MTISNDLHDFSVWSFGEDYSALKVEDFVPRWNTLHGTKYYIIDDKDEGAILKKMRALWLDTVSKDTKEKGK
jgi:hypothetical protein